MSLFITSSRGVYQYNLKNDTISKIIDYEGDIIWDKSKPDGTPRKKLDNYFINKLGWKEKTNLDIGLKQSIKYFEKEYYS